MAHEVEPKVGGWLFVSSKSSECIEQIEEITEHHIIAGLSKYNLKTGRLENANPFFEVFATAISDKKAIEIGRKYRMEREVKKMRKRIMKAMETANHDTLTKIVDVLDRMKEVAK